MEQSEILARFAKGREFDKTVSRGWKFRLRLPTDFTERRLAINARAAVLDSAIESWKGDMVLASVIGWEGPTLDDLLHEGDKTALPFAPALVGPLLESHLDVTDELSVALIAERKARHEKIAGAAKNSASASSGS